MKALNLVLTLLFYSLRALGRSRSELLLENVAMRRPIDVLMKAKPLPRLPPEERMLWVALRRTWSRWQDALLLVQPETVVAWHRKAFRRYWTEHPTAPWVIQQLREAFPYDTAPSDLVFDRDSIFSESVISAIRAIGDRAEADRSAESLAEWRRRALDRELPEGAVGSRGDSE